MTGEEKKNLVIAHGDGDGVFSAVKIFEAYGLKLSETAVIFTQPFLVDKVKIAETVERVFVVDIAVNNRDPEMTRKFIEKLGDKLVIWYDHHQGWLSFFRDNLKDNKELTGKIRISNVAKSCAELIANTSTSTGDQWVADANASDTREGELSKQGQLIEEAMKANLRDDSVRESAVQWIVNGCKEDEDYQKLQKAQVKYQAVQAMTEELAKQYEIQDGVAVMDVRNVSKDYDRTQLLLKGEQMAPTKTAVVLGKNPEGEEVITVATMDKEKNLVNLFSLPSGAPFRISLPVASGWTVEKVVEKLVH